MPKRNVNIELFRVIATLLVVMLHVLGQGGVLAGATPRGTNYWIAYFLEIGALCAVNCFALISGYVMVGKTIKIRRIISLWLQVVFYSLLLTGLVFIFLPESRSLKQLVFAVLPISGGQWWYISSYFALFFFIPFLNKAIENISKQTFKKLLIVTFIGICCLNTVLETNPIGMNKGYSAAWLAVMYLFGAYVRKYNVEEKITATKAILGFFAMVALTFLSKIGIHYLTVLIFGAAKRENVLICYTSFTIFLAAVFLLLFCLKLKINPGAAKIISFLSPTALGVYLIHVHPLVFEYVVKDLFRNFAQKSPPIMVLYSLAAVFAVFVVCVLIEWLRIQAFRWIKMDRFSAWLEKSIHRLYHKVFKEEKTLPDNIDAV